MVALVLIVGVVGCVGVVAGRHLRYHLDGGALVAVDAFSRFPRKSNQDRVDAVAGDGSSRQAVSRGQAARVSGRQSSRGHIGLIQCVITLC